MGNTVPQIGASSGLYYSTTGASGSYTLIAATNGLNIGDVDVETLTINRMDANTLNGNPVEDYGPGWVKYAPYTCKAYTLTAQTSTLRGLAGLGTVYWKVIKSSGDGYKFPGFINKFGDSIPIKEYMMTDLSIQPTGGTIPVFSTSQS